MWFTANEALNEYLPLKQGLRPIREQLSKAAYNSQ